MSGLCFCDSAAQVLPAKILVGSVSVFSRKAYSIGGRSVKDIPAALTVPHVPMRGENLPSKRSGGEEFLPKQR